MQRRLNLAAALLHRPTLVVLDEPTVGVDAQSRAAVLATLAALRDAGSALLYTSHYMDEVERLCDRVGIVDRGRMLAEGRPPTSSPATATPTSRRCSSTSPGGPCVTDGRAGARHWLGTAAAVARVDVRRWSRQRMAVLAALVLPLVTAALVSAALGGELGVTSTVAVADLDGGPAGRAFRTEALGDRGWRRRWGCGASTRPPRCATWSPATRSTPGS